MVGKSITNMSSYLWKRRLRCPELLVWRALRRDVRSAQPAQTATSRKNGVRKQELRAWLMEEGSRGGFVDPCYQLCSDSGHGCPRETLKTGH